MIETTQVRVSCSRVPRGEALKQRCSMNFYISQNDDFSFLLMFRS